MRRFLLILSLFGLLANNVQAGEATTDHFTVSDLETDEGYYYFAVSLEGSRIYTAYNMDIHLPEGISPVLDEDGNVQVFLVNDDAMYPTTGIGSNKKFLHEVGGTWGVVGHQTLRLVCNSQTNAELKKTSGLLFMVYVNVSPYTKAGSNTMTIDVINLIEKENAKQYDPADEAHTLTAPSTATLTLNISSANQWSTCVLPFALNPLPDGVQAYSCGNTDGDYLTLTEETSMQAYTPYILFAENGYSQSHTGTVPAEGYAAVVSAGYLRGAVAQQSITEGYVLQNLDDGVKFYACGGHTFVIPEGRCWLDLSGLNARNAYGLQSPEAAAITATTVQKAKPQPVYDLSGRRVATPQPGHIYVVEGRKSLKIK